MASSSAPSALVCVVGDGFPALTLGLGPLSGCVAGLAVVERTRAGLGGSVVRKSMRDMPSSLFVPDALVEVLLLLLLLLEEDFMKIYGK